ncbi:MAG: helix-turn-helix domain-containing protein [Eubacterium sp.]|nr:helix-turn-helix domain-containing protein [Eubacterium sp.]
MNFREQKEFLKAGNYFFIPNDIFFYGLTPKAFAVLCYLAYISDDTGECHPSRKTIGEHCHIKYGAVDKALKELVENGMIEIEPRYENNLQTSSVYSLCYIRGKKKLIYNLVADLNGIIEQNKRRGTKYLDGKLD